MVWCSILRLILANKVRTSLKCKLILEGTKIL
nr:MAG TPA: hypothetical protein [Caudoviricetes sp.]